MRFNNLKIIPTNLIPAFLNAVTFPAQKCFNTLQEQNFEALIFSKTTSSAVHSAKIEGENVVLSDLIKNIKQNTPYKTAYINPTKDLYNAYCFAQENTLTLQNLLKTHQLITRSFLTKKAQGKIRTVDEIIFNEHGNIVYTAATKETVSEEFKNFIHDLEILKTTTLTLTETFYFASMLHLVLVKIHPFEDGNGRLCRLVEKWFLAEKLNRNAWSLDLEKNYHEQQNHYFTTLNKLGLFYEEVSYNKGLPFLLLSIQQLKKQCQ